MTRLTGSYVLDEQAFDLVYVRREDGGQRPLRRSVTLRYAWEGV